VSRASGRLERTLARAMRSDDPVAALRRAARDAGLDADLRRRLARVDADGVRIAALLVARLRFERLLRGCPEAEDWFDRDGAGFADAFRRYHREVPMRAFFPGAEARLFRAWCARRGGLAACIVQRA
jgi:hypothetical protein